MKVDVQDVGPCRKTLRIEIPPEDIKAELEKTYEEISKTVSVPGFRKGKAPRNVLKMRFSEYAKTDVIGKLVPPSFEKAMKDANLEVLRPLEMADMKPPIDELSVKEGEPLIFEVTVNVKPEIVIPDLSQLEIEKGDVNVTKEDVDKYLDQLREERASFIPVEDRPVREGDYVTVSIRATSDGEVLEDQKEQVLEVGASMPIPELAQHLVDMKPGDDKEFSISFPPDYPTKHLAGREAIFHASLHKITEKHLPPLDDEFAKDMGEEDLQHFTASVWNQLVELKRQLRRDRQKYELVSQLLEKSQFDVPEFMVEEQTKALMQSEHSRAHEPAARAFASTPGGEISDEELAKYRSSALNMIKRIWILESIAEREGVEVKDEEVEAQVRIMAEHQNKDPQKYMRLLEGANRLEGIKDAIWEYKIFNLLIEKASAKRTLIV